MLSYFKILRQAYAITKQHKLLWLFGLFLAGGFNVNFLHFQDLNWTLPQAEIEFYKILFFVQEKPEILAFASLGLLFGTIVSILATNWSRIMLVLSVDLILEGKPYVFLKQAEKSGKFLWKVIKVSLLTSAMIMATAVILLVPPVFFVQNFQSQIFLWILGLFIFLPLVFTISAINIFSAFFIIKHRLSVRKALDITTDFFVANWTKILALAAVLMLIYSAVFVLGIGLTLILKLGIGLIFKGLAGLGLLEFSGIIVLTRIISGVLLWAVVAGLNVFFNTSLFLLFLELVKADKYPKALKKGAAASVA